MRTVRSVLITGFSHTPRFGTVGNVIADAQIVTNHTVVDASPKADTRSTAGQPTGVEGIGRAAPDLGARAVVAAAGTRAGRTDSVDATPDSPLSVLPTTRRPRRCRQLAFGYARLARPRAENGLEGARARAGRHLTAWAQREGLTLVEAFADFRESCERGFNTLVAAAAGATGALR